MKENSIKTGVCMFAFASGNVSTEGNTPKYYKGVGSVYVLGVNPNKSELEKFFNREMDKDPEYIGEQENMNGEKVATSRIDFIIKTDPEKCNNIEYTGKYSIFLRNEYMFNRDKTKVKVIDKYGRTAWVTVEQCKNHEIPIYSNGNPANIDKNYRPCYTGEEELVKFLIAYLNIPNVMKYINGEWVMVDNASDCEAGLEKINDYFKGNFKELKDIIALQPNNKLKICFGVRTTDDNKQYQAFFTQMPLKNSITNYSKLDKEIQERKNSANSSSSIAHTEYDVEDLHEYVVEATTFESEPNMENTFDSGLPWQ